MDLRHYDTLPHGLGINYEDWKPGWATPLGVANTSELTLWAFDAMPSNEAIVQMAATVSAPPMLVCTPEYYHDQRAFGSIRPRRLRTRSSIHRAKESSRPARRRYSER